jgi:hypothetical protein
MLPRQVLVAHVCNPSSSEGRDQEDCSLRPALANSSGEHKRRAGRVAQVEHQPSKCEALSSNPNTTKKES